MPTDGRIYQRLSDGSRGVRITSAGTPVSDALGRVIFAPDADENGSPLLHIPVHGHRQRHDQLALADPKTSGGATVTVNVTEVNDTPIANGQHVTTAEDTDVTITLTGADGDPDVTQSLSYTVSALPAFGQVYQRAAGGGRGAQITSAGTSVSDALGRVIFAPLANDNRIPYAVFQFTVTDNGTTAGVADPKTSSAAMLLLDVTEANDTPTADAQGVSTAQNTDVTITLTGADGDPEVSQSLTFTISSLPTDGQVYQRAVGGGRGALDHQHRHTSQRCSGSRDLRAGHQRNRQSVCHVPIRRDR